MRFFSPPLALIFSLLLSTAPLAAYQSQSPFSLSEIADDFPAQGFETEIAFWTRVFTEWDEKHIIFHDMRDLGLIYHVQVMEKGIRHDDDEKERQREVLKEAREAWEDRLAEIGRWGTASPRLQPVHLDLIRRVRERGMEITPRTFRELSEQVRYQRGVRDKYLEGLIRSRRYLDRIEEIFQDHGLPKVLALMGHVESSFDFNAYSKVGAVGIWQFMRSTGRRYLRINRYIDERRDPIKATHAAARYISENHEKLGNWPFTVTAYNHGPYGMLRALKRHGNDFRQTVDHYQSRTFGFASRNFYPSFLAAIEVDRNYRRYFGEVEFDPPAAFDTIRLENGYHVSHLEKLSALDLEQLQSLNPHLTRYVWQRSRVLPAGVELHLPAGQGEKVEAALASFKPTSSPVTVAADGSMLYRVRSGNTLGSIARSFGTSIRSLMRWNGISNPHRIYAGQLLVVSPPSPLGEGIRSSTSGPSK
ncbi:MAG TPA: transglycosylase SLT domain-containing protein [Acidobacteriota bacterium]|nr:transglycosylase SLT domain-containing protein [Acidobacteriota bacterium]